MKNKYISLILILIIATSVFADNIGYPNFGTTSNTIGNNSATNTYGSKYTSSNGGTLTFAYINGHNNWNGDDTVVVSIYDDTGGYPHNLIAESAEIEINTSSFTWWSATISGTILAATDYWIFVRNKTIGTGSVRIHNDANIISGYRTSDSTPTNDPFANGATLNNNSEYSIYLSYITSTGRVINSFRRRKICNGRK